MSYGVRVITCSRPFGVLHGRFLGILIAVIRVSICIQIFLGGRSGSLRSAIASLAEIVVPLSSFRRPRTVRNVKIIPGVTVLFLKVVSIQGYIEVLWRFGLTGSPSYSLLPDILFDCFQVLWQ